MTVPAGERFDRTSVRLLRAEGPERRACRMLLSEADRLGHVDELFLATTAGPAPTVLGGLSLMPARGPSGVALIAAARVVRAARRRGVGTALLEATIDEARRIGAVEIVARADPIAGADGVAFLEAKGFLGFETFTTVEVPTDAIVAYLEPLGERLREANLIPRDARMQPLREAPIEAVARLHAEHLGGTTRGVIGMLRELLARDDADDHAVLVIGEEVHGVLLGHTADGVTKVEAEVLSPACRVGGGSSGWASLFMLTERLRWGLARGSRLTRFSFFSNNRPTRRIAARLAARPIAEARMYRIEVPAS